MSVFQIIEPEKSASVKVNPFSLSELAPDVQTRTFTQKNRPGVELTFSMCPLEGIVALNCLMQSTEELIETYVIGKIDESVKPDPKSEAPPKRLHPTPLMLSPGKMAKVTERECQIAAQFVAMQSDVDAQGKPVEQYSAHEFLALIFKMKLAMADAFVWIGSMTVEDREEEKNDSGASTEESSEPPSITPDNTPNSSSGRTESASASTPDLVFSVSELTDSVPSSSEVLPPPAMEHMMEKLTQKK